jgi:hypothetical protein
MAFKVLQVPFFPNSYTGMDQTQTVAALGIDSDRLRVPARVLSQFLLHHFGSHTDRTDLLSLAILYFTQYPVMPSAVYSFGRQCDSEAELVAGAIREQANLENAAYNATKAGGVPSFSGKYGAELAEILAEFEPLARPGQLPQIPQIPPMPAPAGPRNCTCDQCDRAGQDIAQALANGTAGKPEDFTLTFPSTTMTLGTLTDYLKVIFRAYPALRPTDL